MSDWWSNDSDEVFWCEITDRADLGFDLKCPQLDEQGRPYWSYDLIHSVWPGDIVLHYSTRDHAFVGTSVAGGPVEERAILWVPHGTIGRANPVQRHPRPGWRLPLYGYYQADAPLSIFALRNAVDEEWIRAWISEKERMPGVRRVAAPFQRYGAQLRGAQGYLTKMPKDFVGRWPELTAMADAVGPVQDGLAPLAAVIPPAGVWSLPTASPAFRPKSEAEYLAVVQASLQRRTRNHERLVRQVGESLRIRGVEVSTPHPIDLFVDGLPALIFEAKLVRPRGALTAIREAVGQLHEYRYFYGPRESSLCVLLDRDPGPEHVTYVEGYLGLFVAWWSPEGLLGGPQTADRLSVLGVQLA